jgi:hypothetical protein
MRNLLAFLAVLTLTFTGVGWYLGWYHVQWLPAPSGHRRLVIDVDTAKVVDDTGKGLDKGRKHLNEIADKNRKDQKPVPAEKDPAFVGPLLPGPAAQVPPAPPVSVPDPGRVGPERP